jgi:oligopeptide transport system substrate-binding protein
MLFRSLTFFFAAAIMTSALAACQPQKAKRAACPAAMRCLEYGNGGDVSSLDPQLVTATNEAAVMRELFEGMFTDADNGDPALGVAKSWEVSPDGLTWTFHLRPEVWSDGVPVTAEDFVYAYRRILDPKTGSSYAYIVYVLKNGQTVNEGHAPPDSVGAEALDDHTLQLTLEHPAAYLPQLLKHQAFFPIPAHVVRRWGDAWVQPGHMVSNGAYTLTIWRLGDYLQIVKNPRYHDAAKVCFDRVNFYPTTDPISAERRVLRSELDVNDAIQSSRVAFLRAQPGSAPFVHTEPYLSTTYLIFNRHDPGPLRDARVRRALSMAIDRDFLARKLLRAGQVPRTAFVPLGIAGYVPDAERPQASWEPLSFAARQAEARRLLAEAGYGPARPLKLVIKTFNSPTSYLMTQSIQSDLKAVGVDASIRQEDGVVALQSFEARDFQIGTVAWIADYDDPMTYLGLMKADTGAQNYGDYNNPAFDALLDQADHEPDGAKRARILARAEQMVLDDDDVAALYTGVNSNLVSPRITGWVDNSADIHPIRDLCLNDAGGNRPKSTP